jgi:hypothetical protein
MNGEHLSPKTRELLDKPIEERIAHIPKGQLDTVLASQQDPATTRRFVAVPQVRPHAEPGDLGSDQQWQDAAHETFLIAAPGQRDDRGASPSTAKRPTACNNE